MFEKGGNRRKIGSRRGNARRKQFAVKFILVLWILARVCRPVPLITRDYSREVVVLYYVRHDAVTKGTFVDSGTDGR